MADQAELGELLVASARTQVDLLIITDADLRITDINPAAVEHTGFTVDQLVGRPVLDLVHPDDLHHAALGRVILTRPAAGLRSNPIHLRLQRADGGWLHLDVNGVDVTAADGTARTVFIGRASDDLDLSERLIRHLISGGSSSDAFALVPEFGRWRQPAFDVVVVHRDDDGAATASGSGSGALLDLVAESDLSDPTTPWHGAARTGAAVIAAVDDLDPAFATRARAAGIEFVRCRPVDDPLHGDAAVVVLAQRIGAHGEGAGNLLPLTDYIVSRVAMMLELVVTWRKQVVELRRSAATDPLTGLANRSGFWATLDAAPRRRALLYVDLDRFKVVNDAHGHAFGDALLVAAADRLASAVRPGDLIARLGGDEFGVVLDGADAADAEAVAARLVGSLTEPFVIDGYRVEVGASVGVATTESAAVAPADLLAAADRALYRAKGSGRGGWSVEALD